jgi:hypothetical protein
MQRVVTAFVVTTCLMVASGRMASGQVPARTLDLEFHPDGTVSLKAANVTVREVLALWAQQCGCYVVNADQLTGDPIAIPVEFTRAPQGSVLESLLRSAAGYVLTPRRPDAVTASNYETIYILATSSPVASTTPFGAYSPVPAVPIVSPGSPDDEIPPVVPMPQPGVNRPVDLPVGPAPAPARPSVPGVSAPMVIVPIGPAPSPSAPPAPSQPQPGN